MSDYISQTFYAHDVEALAKDPESFFREGISSLLNSLSSEDFKYIKEVMYLRQDEKGVKHEPILRLTSTILIEEILTTVAINELVAAFENLRKNSIITNY